MEKSPDAFRTISEVADWLGVQTHVLRFWESKFTQVKPVKRAGGRRYYRPSDMLLLGGIKTLLHDDGMTIKGVQKLIRENGTAHVAGYSQSLETDSAEEAGVIVDAEPVVADEPENVVPFQAREETTPAPEPEPVQAEAPPVPPPAPTDVPETAEEAEPVAEQATPPAAEDDDAPALPAFLTQPMGGGTAPEPPRARIVDAPDPPAEAEIATAPGALGAIARIGQLDADTARDISPLLSRLAVLRDRMQTRVS